MSGSVPDASIVSRWSVLRLALWLVLAPSLAAHAPHDEVALVALSPSFATDGTAFIQGRLTDRLVLGRTTDHGKSWTILRAACVGQKLTDLALSPAWSSDHTMFAATIKGGVWRSTDGGLTWTGSTAGLPGPTVNAIAVSPRFTIDHTVLAATSGGLFRSTDGGVTWSLLDVGLTETAITAVSYAPGTPGVIYAGRLTLHRSNDGGSSFVALQPLPDPLESLGFSPAFKTDKTMALCFGRFFNGVLRSTDAGVTLEPLLDGLLDARVNDVEVAGDGTLFCVNYAGGCQRLAPGAGTWEHLDEGWEELSDLTDNHSADVVLSPDFVNDGVVFVASYEGLFLSDDAGDLWHQADVYTQRLSKEVAFSPGYADDGLVFVGNYGGGPFVYRELGGLHTGGQPADLGGLVPGTGSGPGLGKGSHGTAGGLGAPAPTLPGPGWSHLGTNVGTLWSSVLTLSPSFVTDRTLFTAYNGLYRSRDGGQHWDNVPTPAPVPRVLTPVPTYPAEPTLFLGSSDQGSYRSDDDGATWQVVPGLPGNMQSTAIAIAPDWPADPRIYWSGQIDGIWRSSDGGATFDLVTTFGVNHKLRALALSPDFLNDDVILAATNGFGVHRSDDGGDTWTAVNTGLPSGDDNVIESVVVSPDFASDQTAFLASMYDGVFRSTDGGFTWAPAGIGLPDAAPRALAISPEYAVDRTLYLTTFDWVWRSTDGGDSWQKLPGDIRVNDHHPTAGGDDHSGDWTQVTAPGNYALTVQASNVAGASKHFVFRGDRVTWFAQMDSESGLVDVFLDGGLVNRFDLYSAETLPQRPIVTRLFPTVDWHDVELVVVGVSGPSSRGTWVKTDGFRQGF